VAEPGGVRPKHHWVRTFPPCFVFVSIDLTAYGMKLVIARLQARLKLVNLSDAPTKLFRVYTALYLYASL
jgi:hypothetical protein